MSCLATVGATSLFKGLLPLWRPSADIASRSSFPEDDPLPTRKEMTHYLYISGINISFLRSSSVIHERGLSACLSACRSVCLPACLFSGRHAAHRTEWLLPRTRNREAGISKPGSNRNCPFAEPLSGILSLEGIGSLSQAVLVSGGLAHCLRHS